MEDKVIDIEELAQDAHNFNKGNEQGQQLMERSFKELGAGRSILLDRNGNIIAGNKSQQATDRIGIDYPAGRDMTLGVKADSIIDELSRIIEPRVTIHFTDPSRAVTITPIDPLYQGEEITMLLMPMLVND